MKPAPSNNRIELLREQFHKVKNGTLQLNDFKLGSGKKVWWKCPQADDHIWQASIVKRINGGNCPVCAGRLIVKSNCLTTTNFELTKQWHSTKNINLKPENVYKGSEQKVWWICPANSEHEWQAQIKHRAVGGGCPICNGKTVIPSSSISVTHSHLIKEWNFVKNKNLRPTQVVSGSDKIVWWICKKNPLHEWQATIKRRTLRNHGCPYCNGRIADIEHNLVVSNPEIAAQWNYEKNTPLKPEQFRTRSNKKVWWFCSRNKSHTYPSTITNRVQGFGCPICVGRLVDVSNSLQTLFPNIAKQWHPTLNETLTPNDIVASTSRRYWWKCSKGEDHEWITSSASRIIGTGCPICEGLKVVKSNCLTTTHPDLAKQWHPTKNENITSNNVVAGSHKKIWWICSNIPLHEWKASVKNRSSKQHGCPYCKLTNQSKQELTILFELKSIFASINPKGHYFNDNGKKFTVDIFVKELNMGVEFDGSYWHRNKDVSDKQKNEICEANGIKIIRIREHPLLPTSDFDITSSIPFSPKVIVNKLLQKIKTEFKISANTLKLIDDYCKQKDLQAESDLDVYIQMLFRNKLTTEKNKKPKEYLT